MKKCMACTLFTFRRKYGVDLTERCAIGLSVCQNANIRVFFMLKTEGLPPQLSILPLPNGFYMHVKHHGKVKDLERWAFYPLRKRLKENPGQYILI